MTVASLLADAKGYTGKLVGDATSAMSGAIEMVRAVGYVLPGYFPVTLPNAPPASLTLTPPTQTNVALDLPPEPTQALTFQDISAFDVGVVPILDAQVPTITLPSTPSQVAEFLQNAPAINTNIAFPEPPSALLNPLIEAPTLPDRTAPTAPQVSLPVFGTLAPVDTSVAPTDLKGEFDRAYRSAAPSTIAMLEGYVDAQLTKFNPRYHEQMARIEAQLTTYMNGGTGLKPEVENAIYSRAREKNEVEATRLRDAAYSEAAKRGFTLPTGALLSAVARARQEAANNNLKAASDIVVMQAEMEQKNLQFAVTTSTGLRQSMVSAALAYHQNLVQINGQALDYAKTVMSAIIEVYNSAIKTFGLKLDAYKTEAMVYETRLKSAMAGIELYRIEISALEALTNVDKAKVDVYRARIDALTSLSNVYRAQIEAVVGRTSLEKLKLDLFQAQVQSYSVQVQAKNAEWQGYSAAIEGQTAKVKIFGTQVDAFNARVQGYKAEIEAKSEVVRATAITNQARATQYSAVLSGYSAVVQARGERARTQLENQRQVIVAFQAQSQAAIADAQVRSEFYKATSMVGIENAKLQMTAQIQTAESTRNFGESMARLGTANATIYANLAGSAMSGMNTLAAQTATE